MNDDQSTYARGARACREALAAARAKARAEEAARVKRLADHHARELREDNRRWLADRDAEDLDRQENARP
jgi:hypothetical protein